jgi:hypothetical protein
MEELIKAMDDNYNRMTGKAQKYLDTLSAVSDKLSFVIENGTHDDSAVDLATMINKVIGDKLGEGAL